MLWFVAGLALLVVELFWRRYIWMSLGMGALAAGISLEYIQRAEWQLLVMLVFGTVVFMVMHRIDRKWITRGGNAAPKQEPTTHNGEDNV